VLFMLCPARSQITSDPPKPAGTNLVRVIAAYDSPTGNTEKMAEGVVAGAKKVPGVAVVVKPVEKVAKEDMDTADGIILGCPPWQADDARNVDAALWERHDPARFQNKDQSCW
jgi:flavodoxin